MLQLKSTLIEFLKCKVGDGCNTSFWYDTWTNFGQLITFIGDAGPRQLRIRKDAKVADAVRNGDWNLPAARSNNSLTLLAALTELPAPTSTSGADSFLWRNATGNFSSSFSSKETWEQLRVHSPPVPLAAVVWFCEHVPRFSFITWLAVLQRFPTRDHLRGWGMNILAACVLCSTGLESHHHMFFNCSYSSEIWCSFASRVLPIPPRSIDEAISQILLLNQPHQAMDSAILKLLLQTVVYHLWKERNSRIFSATSSPPAALRLVMDRSMRDKLLSFPGHSVDSSLFLTYFTRFWPHL
ncbi:PREDICTED: uncharacterized protein LOC109125941 [Camelina sativa]|uniref:Uncharacterized protein LOC109125941 n=1 Tax=Camelina sativa TaxID=90675 RepID=A0ABM1QC13_CAMSA|nr:PREDICTED: uncharacterized protein LOC109125941 [Camelina sativa]